MPVDKSLRETLPCAPAERSSGSVLARGDSFLLGEIGMAMDASLGEIGMAMDASLGEIGMAMDALAGHRPLGSLRGTLRLWRRRRGRLETRRAFCRLLWCASR